MENWPDIDDTMRNEVLQNLYIGSTDIVIRQDNFWNFEPRGFKQGQNKKYGFIKTMFGWSLCGYISKNTRGGLKILEKTTWSE